MLNAFCIDFNTDVFKLVMSNNSKNLELEFHLSDFSVFHLDILFTFSKV